MPSTTRTPHQALRRDSWPPTQMHLRRSIEAERTMDAGHHEDLSLDDDPINFFLTPTPLLDDGDTDEDEDVDMDMDMEMNMTFDAGIEDPHHPQPAIRSISPSDLTGPSHPPSSSPKLLPLSIRSPIPSKTWSGPRSPPSRNSPEPLTPNADIDDDDDEDYVRFTPRGMSFNLPSFNEYNNFGSSKSKGSTRKAAAAAKAKAKQQVVDENDGVGMMMAQGSATTGTLLSPPESFHVGRPPVPPSTRGRSTTAVGRPSLLAQRPRSWSGATGYSSGRLSPRAWREPSPDVWSIEEEPEEDLMMREVGVEDVYAKKTEGRKAWKRVRFVLPVTEEIP
ncbi:hypothetical protein VMCG_02889 [Cytospora schulzeri]|uniref:Uncharacterized protein n=1 Tax=Cytospora schulzeri TaxID=448051 RepID=A0A423WZL7_9PEZI|nr:hypothetical protein VMCG_02889 [Valsa malicola]